MCDSTLSAVPKEERRGQTQVMIEKLLAERQELLIQFCQTAGLQAQPSLDQLQSLCQILVDYAAFGHFEIYERIVSGQERRMQVIDVAKDVYDSISTTSSAIVEFNDKYDSSDHSLDFGHLEEDLSQLGEVLAKRIENEDLIVQALVKR